MREESRGGGNERGGNEGNDRMEKLGTIGMLIRFARSLGSFVLFCECRSSAGVGMRFSFHEGERIKVRENGGL